MSTTPARSIAEAEEAPRERTSLFDSNMNETQRRTRFLSLLSGLCLVAIVLVLVSPATEETEYFATSAFSDSISSKVDSLGSTLLYYGGYPTPAPLNEGAVNTDAIQFNGAALSSWSEASLYIQRTDALYQSRPSSFGPHLKQDFTGLLFPITAFAKDSNSYACSPLPTATPSSPLLVQRSNHEANRTVPPNWIALVQRGNCPFSDKVRVAQSIGASAVLFGDQSYEGGGIGGFGGLLTPWSPGSFAYHVFTNSLLTRRNKQMRLPTSTSRQRSYRERHICRSSRLTPTNNDRRTKTNSLRRRSD